MRYAAWTEVDFDALRSNIATLRSILGPTRKILLVVKADAYGHGAVEVSVLAEKHGIDYLGVATVDEGIELRRAHVSLPILVLSPALPGEAEAVVKHGLRASVSSLELGRAIAAAARARRVDARVHLEVDTGMGRAGASPAEALRIVEALTREGNVVFEGVYTHFASADGGDQSFTRLQMGRFQSFLAELRAAGFDPGIVHAANSGAILGAPETWLDMVRSGLLLYGLARETPAAGGAAAEALASRFQPVMSFKTRVVHLRWMEPGETVSYGRTHVMRERGLVATIAAGYGHGLPWNLSGTGEVLLRGRRVPIIGRVTMDLTMVDATGVPEAALGDEVVLFGRQGGETLSAHQLAERAGTLVYEVVCGLGKRVVRTYSQDGRAAKAMTLVGEETL